MALFTLEHLERIVNLSAQEAADAVGMSKPGIIKAIKSGRISATKDLNGGWRIEPAELFRVYSAVTTVDGSPPPSLPQDTPPSDSSQVEVRHLQQRLLDKDDVIADLRRRLDAEADERRKLTLILTDKQAASQQQGIPIRELSWWERLLGWG